EYQILDNCSNHIDNTLGVNGNRRAGSLYDLIPPDPQNAKCADEWNHSEIIVYEGTVVFRMNGENTMEFHLWTDEWNKMIAESKFPDFNPDFASVAKTGYIGLQDHGHAVWFKNIKIKEL
ncbi:MAG: 3-keto-disaccharide hydrolase, partial [Bacteroidales bacterium]